MGYKKPSFPGTSLVVRWLRLHAPTAVGPGSIPGQGLRFQRQNGQKKWRGLEWSIKASFSGSPAVNPLPSKTGAVGLIPGQETNIPYALGSKTKT